METSNNILSVKNLNFSYGNNRILADATSEEPLSGHHPRSHFRLALTEAVAQVLENGLKLLHIEVPEKM